MAEVESKRTGSAAELLGDWRAAERDVVTARETASVAQLAASAAEVARQAALETREAARLSSLAARRAEESAARTAEAAEVTAHAAITDMGDAETALQGAIDAEAAAGERFHAAEREGFPKS